MGGAASKQNLPVTLVVKRLSECMIPDERETIFDYIEMLVSKFASKLIMVRSADLFKDNGGVELIFKIMKTMMKDDVAITLCVQLFDKCKTRVNVIMDFIQFGGLDILDRVMKDHEKNKILMSEVSKLLKSVLMIGANAAISEIATESELLVMCGSCQEAIDRKRRLKSTGVVSELKAPTPFDRIRRVLTFMHNYSDRVDVLEVGLDACMSYAANKDCKTTMWDTSFLSIIGKALKDHGSHGGIMWRACIALSIVAGHSQEVAANICRENVHEILCQNWNEFANEPHIQMSIFWLFDALLRYEQGPSRRRIWQSQRCVDLFLGFTAKREKMLSKSIMADKHLPFKVVLPLSVRSFLRETGGELLPEDLPPVVVAKEFAKRRNFDEHAKFGEIGDEMMRAGEKGLVDGDLAKVERGGKAMGQPEVKLPGEEKLTYGKGKASPADKKKNQK
jgi:hypothetical protein